MLAAEKRYQLYEDYYDDYKEDSQVESRRSKAISAGDKIKLLMLLVSLGAMCIVMIMASALTSQIKYNINSINNEINIVEGEIENIVVEIEQESKIIAIEEKAMNELGMIYPSGDQIVFLENITQGESDFAAVLKEEAYN